jgi:hypothetical protein
MSPMQSHQPNAGSRVNPIVGRNVLSAQGRWLAAGSIVLVGE